LKACNSEPRKIVTDKLGSYRVAHRELTPESINCSECYKNNRAEQSHETTRMRARVMRRFKSTDQSQWFLTMHTSVQNLFNQCNFHSRILSKLVLTRPSKSASLPSS
jgi:putative transposase